MKFGFGVDLGGTTVKIALFTREGELVTKWEIPTDTSDNGKNILSDIAAAVTGCMTQRGIAKEDCLGIGLCIPGPVTDDGMVNRCVNLGWGVFNAEKALSDLTGLPVQAGNDANVAALGEYWALGGGGDMVMVTLGTGVGGGIVLGGKLLSGTHGCGGEIGHINLKTGEKRTCGCGNHGCAEQYCSATGIVNTGKDYLASFTGETVLSADTLTSKAIFDAAAAGDQAALAITELYYADLGRFLSMLTAVLDPEVIVLGGGVSKAGQPLLEGVARHYANYAFHGTQGVRFALAKLGNDAGSIGAFRLLG